MARLSMIAVALVTFLTITTHYQVASLVNPNQSLAPYDRLDQETLDCHVREFTFLAMNQDPETGLKCQGHISVNSCWGRCGSGEFADYHFPFKKSYHTVCIHKKTEQKLFRLKTCDKGAPTSLRVYKTTVATECACQFCETSNANCESGPHDIK